MKDIQNIDKIGKMNNDCKMFIATEKSRPFVNKFEESQILSEIVKIQITLNTILLKISEESTHDLKELKWKYAAIVFDRFFLFMSSIYTIITFVALLMSIPNFYRFT
jgi:hypothetical protein